MDISERNALNAITAIHPSKAPAHRHAGDTLFLAGLEPGHRLRATVQASYRNGEFAVMLNALDGQNGEAQLLMKLPAGTRQGDVLNLVFLSREPRPAFMLSADPPSSGASFSLLSETGRFITDLLQRVNASGNPVTPSSTAPLLAAPPATSTQAVQLAQGLARIIGGSGLFYESHQAQWIKGSRSLAELRAEPQARLSGQQPAAASGPASATAVQNASPGAQESVYPGPVHPDALALVRKQLEVFETRQIGWQGEAWPGQAIVWDAIEEAPKESREHAQGPDIAWKTRLRLTLPHLGPIIANLRLDARGVDVQVIVAEPGTASMLRTGAAPLANGMESAGIRLLDIGVDVDEENRSA